MAAVQPSARPAPEPLRVARAVRETHDTFTVTLDASQRAGGYPFRPGQFNMLYVFGVGEAPISMSGDAAHPERIVHTVRAVGTVTRAMRGVRPGGALGVRGPFGVGWPLERARGSDVVIVAGGLGLAPLRSAVYHLLRHRRDYGRLAILYGSRAPEDLLYRREIERWRGRLDVEVGVTVDRAGRDWRGRVDVVTSLIAGLAVDAAHALAFVCGPELMMRFAARELEQLGIEQDRIYVALERSMRCGVGLCGHCQYLPLFVCKDGPVLRLDRIAPFWDRREV